MIPHNSMESAHVIAVSDGKIQDCLLPMPGVMGSNLADSGQISLNSFEMKWNSPDSDIVYTNILKQVLSLKFQHRA